jgi:hypothetical protein
MPTEARTDLRPQVDQLLHRVMTERADRAAQRGVRIGLSQPTPFSQTIPDLPEEEEPNVSPEVSQQAVRGDTVDMGGGSGIGIFSQEGMVRGAGMDTDSECEDEGENDEDGLHYHSPKGGPSDRQVEDGLDIGGGDSIAGNDSDRSFMSVQETFNNGTSKGMDNLDKSMREPSMNGGSADAATASATITRGTRSESDSDTEERSSKRARAEH